MQIAKCSFINFHCTMCARARDCVFVVFSSFLLHFSIDRLKHGNMVAHFNSSSTHTHTDRLKISSHIAYHLMCTQRACVFSASSPFYWLLSIDCPFNSTHTHTRALILCILIYAQLLWFPWNIYVCIYASDLDAYSTVSMDGDFRIDHFVFVYDYHVFPSRLCCCCYFLLSAYARAQIE